MKPYNLLFFLDTLRIGGTERQVLELIRNLNRSQFSVTVSCFHKEGPLLGDVERMGIRVVEFPLKNFHHVSAIRQMYRYAQFLKREKIQIVHAYNLYANVFGVLGAKLTNVPVIIASQRNLSYFKNKIQKVVEGIAFSLSDQIVVNSKAAMKTLCDKEGANASKLTVIYNGIDLEKFTLDVNADNLRTEFEITQQTPVVGTIGHLRPVKGHRMFLEAVSGILKSIPNTKFLIVGDGEMRTELEILAEQLGVSKQVIFTGYRHEVPEILSLCNVSVLSSTSESLPNVILESMAMAKPVVATAVGDIPEIVKHGESGFLIPPSDSSLLAKYVLKLLQDRQLAKEMGCQGRVIVSNKFSIKKMVHQTERLYTSLLSQKCSQI